MEPIYLDHNATTPLLPEAAEAMAAWQDARFGNPESQHRWGRQARQALETAREAIGQALGAQLGTQQPDRVILTSGGTEANNLALFGLAGGWSAANQPGEAIISGIEHASVAGAADMLAQRGWTIHRLRVTPDGVVDLADLDARLHAGTRFVSVMLANNETGVLQPVAEIAQRCAALAVPMHTDAVQAVGKLPVDFRALGVSAMTVAAHKFHGPLGAGALIVRGEVDVQPLLVGGFQQAGLRPGTESVMLAVGMQAALAAWQREGSTRTERMQALRDRLETGLTSAYPGTTVIHGRRVERLPHTSNLAFVGLDRQPLLMALDLAGVAASTGSACASGSSEPSRVLTAMGCSPEVLTGSLRFSLGATTTAQQIDSAVDRIAKILAARPLSTARHA